MTPDRGVGTLDALDALLPGWIEVVMVGVTWLGSVPVLGAILAARYWHRPRRDTAAGLAALIAAYGLTIGLKAVFSFPRPPASGWVVAVDGFGFPSGHALTATVVWGYLGATVTRWPARYRLGAGTVLVTAIALSRVVLGVHYLVDVLAGLVAGILLLAVLLVIARRTPTGAFVLAAGIAGFAILVGGGLEAILGLGAALTGGMAVARLETPLDEYEGSAPVVSGMVGVGLAAILLGAYLWGNHPLVALVAGGIVGGGTIILPMIAGSNPIARIRR